ncbi:hypothetical protein [Burkholderia pseudomallei]|uniref:hypothetical protein n=1 Tax=Burkholderia pseudomallei TaxID=28450 RepID=UPI000F068B74|nr:hypothetical protein [Burkholderia pseudomallei]VBG63410.1 Uncharacterised protein [Burkholderia pseudomallei]
MADHIETHPDAWLLARPDVVADVKAVASDLDDRVLGLQLPPGWPRPKPLQTVDQVLAALGAQRSDAHYPAMRRRLGHFSKAILEDDWESHLLTVELHAIADEATPVQPRDRARL